MNSETEYYVNCCACTDESRRVSTEDWAKEAALKAGFMCIPDRFVPDRRDYDNWFCKECIAAVKALPDVIAEEG